MLSDVTTLYSTSIHLLISVGSNTVLVEVSTSERAQNSLSLTTGVSTVCSDGNNSTILLAHSICPLEQRRKSPSSAVSLMCACRRQVLTSNFECIESLFFFCCLKHGENDNKEAHLLIVVDVFTWREIESLL